jgi:hypothetical protein
MKTVAESSTVICYQNSKWHKYNQTYFNCDRKSTNPIKGNASAAVLEQLKICTLNQLSSHFHTSAGEM